MKLATLKIFSVLFVVMGLGLLIMTSGIAHPVLFDDEPETIPNPGQVLTVSPDAIELLFDERSLHGGMNAEMSLFYVVKLPGSSVVARGSMDLTNEFRDTMKAELTEPLDHGEYVVRWIGVSNADNGYTEGIFNFFVGENADGVSTRNEQGTAVGGSGEGHSHSGTEEDTGCAEEETHSDEEASHSDDEEMHSDEESGCATEEETHEQGEGE